MGNQSFVNILIIQAFQLQQGALGRKAAGESGQRAVAADDAVAGDEDADAVRSYGLGNGADTADIAYFTGCLEVGSRFTVGDFLKGFPYRPLEGRADGMQGNVEGCAAAGEILVQFHFSALQDWGGFFPEFRPEKAGKPSHIALSAGLRVPVAEAKLVPDGGKHKFTTGGKVILDVYVRHNSSCMLG